MPQEFVIGIVLYVETYLLLTNILNDGNIHWNISRFQLCPTLPFSVLFVCYTSSIKNNVMVELAGMCELGPWFHRVINSPAAATLRDRS